jgi:hypothetical protein
MPDHRTLISPPPTHALRHHAERAPHNTPKTSMRVSPMCRTAMLAVVSSRRSMSPIANVSLPAIGDALILTFWGARFGIGPAAVWTSRQVSEYAGRLGEVTCM